MTELSAGVWNALAAALWRATWQGSLLIAVLYLCQRLIPGLSPRLRAGAWWAASLKLLFGLVPFPLVTLSVSVPRPPLPATELPPVVLQTAQTAAQQAAQASFAAPQIPWTALLGVVWLVGLAAAVERLVRRHQAVGVALSGASRVSEARVLSLAQAVAARAGLRSTPQIWISPSVSSPFVTGWLNPRIVLPARAVAGLADRELNMVLAHEAAHVRRADLLWGWVPALAELVFWFLPLSWLAAREYAQAREECCDAEAVRIGGAAADSYGRLLLEFGTGRASAPVTAACVASPHFRHLCRRLKMLERPSRSAVRRGLLVAAVLTPFLLMPTRFSASWEIPSAAAQTVSPAEKGHPPYILVVGSSITSSDVPLEVLEALRPRFGSRFLWVQKEDQAYVVTDEKLLQPLLALNEEASKLGEQQAALGSQQSDLGTRQSELGAKQGQLGARQGELAGQQSTLSSRQSRAHCDDERSRLAREQEALAARQDALGSEQEALGQQQEALGREQDALGTKQEALGQKQEEVGVRISARVSEVLARALSQGVAKPMGGLSSL